MAFKRKDILWKSIIEEFPEQFVRFFYKKDAEILFDLKAGFEFLDKELAQIAPYYEMMDDSLTVDKLLKGRSLNKVLKSLLLLVEIQGYREKDFAERVFTYFSRLVDKYGKRILVLVIYTDIKTNYCPSSADYGIAGTSNRFAFETYKVLHQDEALLADDDNLFALIVLAVLLAIKHEIKGTDESLLEAKIFLLKNLKKRKLAGEQETKVLTFIRLYANFADRETNIKFEEQIELIIGKTKDMGIFEYAIQEAAQDAKEQGIEQGQKERSTTVVKNMLLKTRHTLQEIAEITEVPIDFVKSVKMQLVL